jgi:hypothetical protein
MKRAFLTLMLTASLGVFSAAPAFGAEQHPPKFGPHQTQCTGTANQPNCPGSH